MVYTRRELTNKTLVPTRACVTELWPGHVSRATQPPSAVTIPTLLADVRTGPCLSFTFPGMSHVCSNKYADTYNHLIHSITSMDISIRVNPPKFDNALQHRA